MAAIAVAVGVRADSWMRFVPSLMLLVCEPHHASGLMASDPYASAVHTESYPRRSASRIDSTAPAGGPAPQYPTCNPSFMDVETTVSSRECACVHDRRAHRRPPCSDQRRGVGVRQLPRPRRGREAVVAGGADAAADDS